MLLHPFTRCIVLAWLSLALCSCQKYLDQKPDEALAIPSTLADAQALLNDFTGVHRAYSTLPMVSADDFYLLDSYVNSLSVQNRELYLWQTNQHNTPANNWRTIYGKILRANLVIDLLTRIQPGPGEAPSFQDCLGRAYFLRAWCHFWMAQLFAAPYDPATAASLPGIPVRTRADISVPVERGTLAGTYQQILQDLDLAIGLLPAQKTLAHRPARTAAHALKAFVSLLMQSYQLAAAEAAASLQLNSTLIDFNTLDANSNTPFRLFNEEVLFHAVISGNTMLGVNNWKVDTLLQRSYAVGDLRRTVFFRSNGGFKGDLAGTATVDVFAGISQAEVYLVAAEAQARLGNTQEAMRLLNQLLGKRWQTGRFTPVAAATPAEALQRVLQERRKELVGRGLRWLDMRRLPVADGGAVSFTRLYQGSAVVLAAGSPQFTFLIPQEVIERSGIAQNPR